MRKNKLTLVKKIPPLTITLFFRQLAALLSAGIPIVQCCEILRNSQKNISFQRLITTLKLNMEAGNSLSWCLAKFPHHFDPLLCHLVQTGEQSGTLPITLDRIASYKEKSLLLKHKIRQALLYPAIVMIVAMVVCIIMLTVVIPRFAELFQSMHSSLPLFTLWIIGLSQFIRHYYWLSLFPFIAIAGLNYYAQRSLQLKQVIEPLVLRIPYLGQIYLKTILAHFCRSLATTFAAGVPISESLKTMAYANGSYLYAQLILQLRAQITKGQQLHQGMQKQALFPPMLVQMVKIGEESGTLERMLEKVASLYETDFDHWVTNLGHVLEPLIIAILGVLIGGLVIAMYLPIFKLGSVM